MTRQEQRDRCGTRQGAEGYWADWLIRNVGLQIHVHDEPCQDSWFCGDCPYVNVGPVCTKCGAPAWRGTFIPDYRHEALPWENEYAEELAERLRTEGFLA